MDQLIKDAIASLGKKISSPAIVNEIDDAIFELSNLRAIATGGKPIAISNRELWRTMQRHFGGRYISKESFDLVAIAAMALLELRQQESLRIIARGRRLPPQVPHTAIKIGKGGKIYAARRR